MLLGFEIGQRWSEAVMHSCGSYFVPVPKHSLKIIKSCLLNPQLVKQFEHFCQFVPELFKQGPLKTQRSQGLENQPVISRSYWIFLFIVFLTSTMKNSVNSAWMLRSPEKYR
jgi:hypothetical protein